MKVKCVIKFAQHLLYHQVEAHLKYSTRIPAHADERYTERYLRHLSKPVPSDKDAE